MRIVSGNCWVWRKRKGGSSPTTLTVFVANVFLLIVMCPVVISQAGIKEFLFKKAYELLDYGQESCDHPNVHHSAVTRLRQSLKRELFGQNLAKDMILTAITAHLEDPSPSKSLVLSLHGWAGAGKTFTAQKIMNALYQKGENSSFTRFFMSTYHFPEDEKRIAEYQEFVRENIQQVVRRCSRGLFIFDEVDKIPPGVLDTLIPLIHHPGAVLDGYDYKKSIFIFLSNVGANDIYDITLSAFKMGRKREELNLRDFRKVFFKEEFKKESGLYQSKMIESALVDYFIPFLPLERRHVISCVEAEAKRRGKGAVFIQVEEADNIADLLTYWPEDLKLYSKTGCKMVDSFVKYRLAELSMKKRKFVSEDDQEEDEGTDKTEL